LCARGPGVRQVRARGHAANVHCHATRIVRVGVHCAFTLLALARTRLTREGRVNEIPRAHALTFRGLRRLSAGNSAFARRQDSVDVGISP